MNQPNLDHSQMEILFKILAARPFANLNPLALKDFNVGRQNLPFNCSSPFLNPLPLNLPISAATSSTPISNFTPKIKRRIRNSGPANKTAEVWKFFTEVADRQAATCNICTKEIKATNSSTTGMIRHLKSCHRKEHVILQEARDRQSQLKLNNSQKFTVQSPSDELLLDQSENCTKQIQEILKTKFEHSSSFSPSSTASSANATVASSTSFVKESIPNDSGLDLSETRSEDQSSVCASTANSELFSFNMGEYTKQLLQKNDDNAKVLFESSEAIKEEEIENEVKDEIHEAEPEVKKEQGEEFRTLTNHIAMMIVIGKLPEKIVENQAFRALISYLKPEYVMPTLLEFQEKFLPVLRNYVEKFYANNQTVNWPISPSTTVESGFEEFENSEAVAAQNRSLNMSFFSPPITRPKKEDDASSSVESFHCI